MEKKNKNTLVSPVSGKIMSLDSVPDKVFAEKLLGDGCAILPDDGKIFSPVDGRISSIADAKHAFGIEADDGRELLIHFGLETVGLEGRGFDVRVKVGDRVKAGELIAVADLELIRKEGLSTITPVLICNLPEGAEIALSGDSVKACEDAAFEVKEKKKEIPETKEVKKGRMGAFREKSFDFLQRLGKVLMVVIAVMPAAGLMISLGKLIGMAGDVAFLDTVATIMESIGWVPKFPLADFTSKAALKLLRCQGRAEGLYTLYPSALYCPYVLMRMPFFSLYEAPCQLMLPAPKPYRGVYRFDMPVTLPL